MRLNNFASVDPFHQQRGIIGLPGGRRQVEPIWNEFINNREELLFESEKILAKKENLTLESKYSKILDGIENLKGETKIREVKTRINQNLFREIILSAYNNTCCITGLQIQKLLIAGHIKPWSKDIENRLNPQNGIAINALHDKAFEEGLITILPNYRIKVSSVLFQKKDDKEIFNLFIRFEDKQIYLPTRYLPDPKLLEQHYYEQFFK
jgi:putative restriction endonuclease